MKTINKTVAGLLAAAALSLFPAVHAAGLGTEFGIADDLTVLGAGGLSTDDPDLEVKGFSVFGATEADHALGIPKAPGNIFANGYVQVSSGLYVAGSSTFTARLKLPDPGSIFLSNGITGEVLKKRADGSLMWATDDTGAAGTLTGTPLRLLMISASGTGGLPSLFIQNGDVGTNITLVSGSSLTILGDGTNGLGVTGATTLTGLLTVNGYSQFGSAFTRSSFTLTGALDMAANANITLSGTGKITLPNLPSAGTDAANRNYVDSQIGGAGPWIRDGASQVVRLSTTTDGVGIGILVPLAKLHVSSANAAAAELLLAVSTGSLAAQQVFSVNAAGNTVARGNLQQGSGYAGTHGFNLAPAAGTALSVAGQNVPGDFVAKFYSGSSLALWIKKK